MAQNPFATSFSIYAGSIRQRTQMAYQRAMQEMQQKQASDLAQRQFILDRLKLENDQIKNLRAQMNTLKKSIRGSGASDTDQRKILQLVTNMTKVHSDILFQGDRADKETVEKLTKQYVLQPETKAAINSYVRNTITRDLINTQADLESALGTTAASDNSRELATIDKVLSKLETDEERKVAFDYLLKEKYKSFGDRATISNATGEKAIDKMALALAPSLSGIKANDRLSKAEADNILTSEIQKQTGFTKEQIVNIRNLNKNINKINDDIDSFTATVPALTNVSVNIKSVNDQLAEAFKRQEQLRTQLDKPADTEDIDVSTRAGQILLEEEAMAQMGNAIQNMDDSELEALQLMNKARTIKEIDQKSEEFIDAYASGVDPQDNNINSFFKYVDKEKNMPVKQRELLKVSALARLIQAQENDPKQKATKSLYDLAAQREVDQNPLFKGMGDDNIDFTKEGDSAGMASEEPLFKGMDEDIDFTKEGGTFKGSNKLKPESIESARKRGFGNIDWKGKRFLQRSPSSNYAYYVTDIKTDKDGKQVPQFKYLPPSNIKKFFELQKATKSIPENLLVDLPRLPKGQLQPIDEAMELYERSVKEKQKR